MFEKYSEYKDSGVEWLGDIPKHWDIKKTFHYFKAEKGRNAALLTKEYCGKIKGDYPVYSGQTENNGIMSFIDNYEYDFSVDGCLFSTTVGAKAMTVGYLNEKFSLSQNCMIIVKRNGFIYNKFFYYLFQPLFKHFRSQIPDHMQASFRMEDLYQYRIVLPPIFEQQIIANFLDRKTAQIDQAVSIKEKQIELLKERRQILIHNAVTRGLDLDVKMKDSGVEWIGEIPEHWEVKKLKYFSVVQSGITLGKSYGSKSVITYLYLRVANVQSGYFNLDQMAEISMPKREADKYLVRKGDILVTEGGDLDKLGRGTVWDGEIENCLHQNHVFAVRVDTSVISPQFASMIMESDYGRKYFTNTANKTTNLASTNSTKLGNFPVIIAPREEREAIFEYLKDATKKIATAISLKQKEIEKLKEYKSTLINGAVTGKIKV